MKVSTKLKLHGLGIANSNRRARKLVKKINKTEDKTRYPEQWRNDWVVRKAEKVAKILNIEVKVKGWDNLPKAPAILAPNHSSSFDGALMVLALRNPGETSDDLNHQSVFIAKDEVSENKRARGYADMLDTHYLSRKNPREALATLENFAEYAKKNKKYAVIFPSGTRSKDGTVGDFKGGAFRIAKKHYLPIVPVTINNALSITDTNREEKLVVEVIFGETIKPISLMTQDTKAIAKNVERLVRKSWKKPQGKRSSNEDKLA